ncbi:hypothetical protein [uncultured Lacinutrix sp.]|uniref:hypothetical protein n=1 Tax=uncultured Lacinutrix sp. TaxID=574032 RepID=UPI00263481BE|nr:hypothetical protein [uncultured Lacinutrix sp.]
MIKNITKTSTNNIYTIEGHENVRILSYSEIEGQYNDIESLVSKANYKIHIFNSTSSIDSNNEPESFSIFIRDLKINIFNERISYLNFPITDMELESIDNQYKLNDWTFEIEDAYLVNKKDNIVDCRNLKLNILDIDPIFKLSFKAKNELFFNGGITFYENAKSIGSSPFFYTDNEIDFTFNIYPLAQNKDNITIDSNEVRLNLIDNNGDNLIGKQFGDFKFTRKKSGSYREDGSPSYSYGFGPTGKLLLESKTLKNKILLNGGATYIENNNDTIIEFSSSLNSKIKKEKKLKKLKNGEVLEKEIYQLTKGDFEVPYIKFLTYNEEAEKANIIYDNKKRYFKAPQTRAFYDENGNLASIPIGNASDRAFPYLPILDSKELLDLENKVLLKTRENLIQKTNNKSLSFLKNTESTTYYKSSNGLLRDNKRNYFFSEKQTSTEETFKFQINSGPKGDSFLNALESENAFLVLTSNELKAYINSQIGKIDIKGWKFPLFFKNVIEGEIDTTPLIIFKYNNILLKDMIKEDGSHLKYWSNKYLENEKIDEVKHANTIRESIDGLPGEIKKANWQGVIVLNIPITSDELPDDIKGLAKEDDKTTLKADYLAFPISNIENGTIKKTSFFAGINYNNNKSIVVQNGFGFELRELIVKFTNSEITAFNCKVDLKAEKIYNLDLNEADVTNSATDENLNSTDIELIGSYIKIEDKDIYSFSIKKDIKFTFKEFIIKSIELTGATFYKVKSNLDNSIDYKFDLYGVVTFNTEISLPKFEVKNYLPKSFEFWQFGIDYNFGGDGFPFNLNLSDLDVSLQWFSDDDTSTIFKSFPIKFNSFWFGNKKIQSLSLAPIIGDLTNLEFGFLFDLDLGTLGEMSSLKKLNSNLFIGWSGKNVEVGFKFNGFTTSLEINLNDVLGLSIDTLNLCQVNNLFYLQLINCRLTILGNQYPNSENNIHGVIFKDSNNSKLGWLAVYENNEDDIVKMVALGQRVGLSEGESTAEVINEVKSTIKNVELCSSAVTNLYKSDRNWLIAADLQFKDVVDVKFIFNDPSMYGLYLKISELFTLDVLYYKVNDSLGVWKSQFELSPELRNWEFGAVSFTLPNFGLDIFTNGDFKADLGFPKIGRYTTDYSNSAVAQLLPFIGKGGFYLAKYSGGQITWCVDDAGNKLTALQMGMALRVGIGKEIKKSAFYAGASVTVYGIFIGTVCFENNSIKPKGFSIESRVGVILEVVGYVDFSIVKVAVHIWVEIYTSMLIEDYGSGLKPIIVKAGGSVKVRITIVIAKICIRAFGRKKCWKIKATYTFKTYIEYRFNIGGGNTSKKKTLENIKSLNKNIDKKVLSLIYTPNLFVENETAEANVKVAHLVGLLSYHVTNEDSGITKYEDLGKHKDWKGNGTTGFEKGRYFNPIKDILTAIFDNMSTELKDELIDTDKNTVDEDLLTEYLRVSNPSSFFEYKFLDEFTGDNDSDSVEVSGPSKLYFPLINNLKLIENELGTKDIEQIGDITENYKNEINDFFDYYRLKKQEDKNKKEFTQNINLFDEILNDYFKTIVTFGLEKIVKEGISIDNFISYNNQNLDTKINLKVQNICFELEGLINTYYANGLRLPNPNNESNAKSIPLYGLFKNSISKIKDTTVFKLKKSDKVLPATIDKETVSFIETEFNDAIDGLKKPKINALKPYKITSKIFPTSIHKLKNVPNVYLLDKALQSLKFDTNITNEKEEVLSENVISKAIKVTFLCKQKKDNEYFEFVGCEPSQAELLSKWIESNSESEYSLVTEIEKTTTNDSTEKWSKTLTKQDLDTYLIYRNNLSPRTFPFGASNIEKSKLKDAQKKVHISYFSDDIDSQHEYKSSKKNFVKLLRDAGLTNNGGYFGQIKEKGNDDTSLLFDGQKDEEFNLTFVFYKNAKEIVQSGYNIDISFEEFHNCFVLNTVDDLNDNSKLFLKETENRRNTENNSIFKDYTTTRLPNTIGFSLERTIPENDNIVLNDYRLLEYDISELDNVNFNNVIPILPLESDNSEKWIYKQIIPIDREQNRYDSIGKEFTIKGNWRNELGFRLRGVELEQSQIYTHQYFDEIIPPAEYPYFKAILNKNLKVELSIDIRGAIIDLLEKEVPKDLLEEEESNSWVIKTVSNDNIRYEVTDENEFFIALKRNFLGDINNDPGILDQVSLIYDQLEDIKNNKGKVELVNKESHNLEHVVNDDIHSELFALIEEAKVKLSDTSLQKLSKTTYFYVKSLIDDNGKKTTTLRSSYNNIIKKFNIYEATNSNIQNIDKSEIIPLEFLIKLTRNLDHVPKTFLLKSDNDKKLYKQVYEVNSPVFIDKNNNALISGIENKTNTKLGIGYNRKYAKEYIYLIPEKKITFKNEGTQVLSIKPISNSLYTGDYENRIIENNIEIESNTEIKNNTDLEASLRKILVRIEDLLKPENILEESISMASIDNINKFLNYKMEIAGVLQTYLGDALKSESDSKSNMDFRNMMLQNLTNFHNLDNVVNFTCNNPYPRTKLLIETNTDDDNFKAIPGKMEDKNLSLLLDYAKNNQQAEGSVIQQLKLKNRITHIEHNFSLNDTNNDAPKSSDWIKLYKPIKIEGKKEISIPVIVRRFPKSPTIKDCIISKSDGNDLGSWKLECEFTYRDAIVGDIIEFNLNFETNKISKKSSNHSNSLNFGAIAFLGNQKKSLTLGEILTNPILNIANTNALKSSKEGENKVSVMFEMVKKDKWKKESNDNGKIEEVEKGVYKFSLSTIGGGEFNILRKGKLRKSVDLKMQVTRNSKIDDEKLNEDFKFKSPWVSYPGTLIPRLQYLRNEKLFFNDDAIRYNKKDFEKEVGEWEIFNFTIEEFQKTTHGVKELLIPKKMNSFTNKEKVELNSKTNLVRFTVFDEKNNNLQPILISEIEITNNN